MPTLATPNEAPVGVTLPVRPASSLREAAETATDGSSCDGIIDLTAMSCAGQRSIDILLCRDHAMLKNAQQLRYEVYCLELGRQSPHADHDKKIITDDLDEFGHTFIAIEGDETIGTLRTNFAKEGALGAFDDLYGMNASKHHPGRTAICTKFIVTKSRRGSLAFLKLIIAWLQFVTRNGVLECYIDCTPNLVPFYERFEFKVAGDPFFHCENGLSIPMMLDLARHGHSLCERFGVRDNRRLNA